VARLLSCEADPARTAIARAVFRCAGWLSCVKTWQRTYELADNPRGFRCVGRRWLSCAASIRLLGLSERIDPRHWEHWALVHDDCESVSCPDCGGRQCRLEQLE